LEQALKRYASTTAKQTQLEVSKALKNKVISSRLIEEIRFDRFLRHFKP
jgi:hypothetical protein